MHRRGDDPVPQAPDLIAGHWVLLGRWARCRGELVWDNEGAVGSWRRGKPVLTEEFEAFRGMLGIGVHLCRPRDPEAKGLVERANGYFETSFLPGRDVHRPGRLQRPARRLARRGQRPARAGSGCRPIDALGGGPGRDAGAAAGRRRRSGGATGSGCRGTTTCGSTPTTTRSTRP